MANWRGILKNAKLNVANFISRFRLTFQLLIYCSPQNAYGRFSLLTCLRSSIVAQRFTRFFTSRRQSFFESWRGPSGGRPASTQAFQAPLLLSQICFRVESLKNHRFLGFIQGRVCLTASVMCFDTSCISSMSPCYHA